MSCDLIALTNEAYAAYIALAGRCCTGVPSPVPAACVVPSLVTLYREAQALKQNTICRSLVEDPAHPDPGAAGPCLDRVWVQKFIDWLKYMTCSDAVTCIHVIYDPENTCFNGRSETDLIGSLAAGRFELAEDTTQYLYWDSIELRWVYVAFGFRWNAGSTDRDDPAGMYSAPYGHCGSPPEFPSTYFMDLQVTGFCE